MIFCLGTLVLAPPVSANEHGGQTPVSAQSAARRGVAGQRARAARTQTRRAKVVQRVREVRQALASSARTVRVRSQLRALDVRRGVRLAVNRVKQSFAGLRIKAAERLGLREAPQYERAKFYFINGRNNLQSFALEDLAEIVAGSVGDTQTIHVVQMATLKDPTARRYRIFNGTKEDLGPVEGSVDFGAANDAHAFFDWALHATDAQGRLLHSARRVSLGRWDHGGAVRGDNFDDTTKNHVPVSQSGRSYPAADNIDLVVDDLCLGGGIEHLAELYAGTRSGQPAAQVYVASEETEPGKGHDYKGAGLAIAKANPADAREEGKIWVNTYLRSYANGSQGDQDVQSAALSVHAVADLVPRMRVFARELVAAAQGGERAVLQAQAKATQKFFYSEQRDLVHFAQLVAASTQRPALRAAAADIAAFVPQNVVVYNNVSRMSTRYADAHGLAIWMPTRRAVAESRRTLQQIAQGHVPPEYAGYRAAMMSPSMAQAIRANMDNYGDLAFAKLVPEWPQFQNELLAP